MPDPDRNSRLFSHCFVCGPRNPAGLRITYHRDGLDGCRAEYVAPAEHEGWPGVVHGGLLFTLMDEALAWAVCLAGGNGVTGKAEVRFREPVKVGTRLVITGRLLGPLRRLTKARAEARRAEDGVLVAELDGTMVMTDVRPWLEAATEATAATRSGT
jgi:acyl-coenzyme A thioesterase PaaI-like protein